MLHLIIDFESSNVHLMTDPTDLGAWLKETARVVGMTPRGEPVLDGFPWPGSSDNAALSGCQFLAESSITIHCWPERTAVFLDIFSCKDFDHEKALSHVAATFRAYRSHVLVLKRGVDPETGLIQAAAPALG